MNDVSILLPEIVLVGGALALLLADAFLPALRRGGSGIAALALLGLAAALLAFAPTSDTPQLAGTIQRDPLARAFGLVALAVSVATVLASRGYVARLLPDLQTEYYALLLFATSGMLLLPSSTHLVTMFVSLELLSLSSMALVGLERNRRRSAEGGIKFFLLGALSSAVLLYGMALLYGLTGSVELTEIRTALESPKAQPAAVLALAFVLAGLGFKLSLVPFHMWCPDTYEGAPTPIAGFLSVGSKGAALVALWRMLHVGFSGLSAEWHVFVWILAASSMVLGNLVAIMQTNLKRMLAYSTVAHAGYLMVGLLGDSALGSAALFFYLAAYAFMSLGAFAVIAYLDHLKLGEEWADLAGLSRTHPFVAFAFSMMLLSLAGIPPLAGFAGKFLLFSAAVDRGYYLLVTIAVLTSVVSLFYYVRAIKFMYVVAPPDPAVAPLKVPPHVPADRGLGAVLAVGTAGTLVLGFLPQPFLQVFIEAIAKHFP